MGEANERETLLELQAKVIDHLPFGTEVSVKTTTYVGIT